MRIHTIGHSTREADKFLGLLKTHGIRALADIRLVPRSRRHPHFNDDALGRFLEDNGIYYRHFRVLGGRREPRSDSPNGAWRNPSFRGYADYMLTEEFRAGVAALQQFASEDDTTVMCAEAVWWQCHRALLSDYLVSAGVEVLHIMSAARPNPHALSEFAKVVEGRLLYPGLIQAG
jgi:uncharacterized protein (DUF488 family)